MTTLVKDENGYTYEVLEEHHLECTVNTNKFWEGALYRVVAGTYPAKGAFKVKLAWGRIGMPGNKDELWFKLESQARQYYNTRLRDKERKNYHLVKGSSPFNPKKIEKTDETDLPWDFFLGVNKI